MKSLKAPPQFDPEKDNYEQFKKDIQIWELLTELDAKKKGPAVYLSLQNKAREAVRNISVAEVSADGGLQTIIDRLDEVYLADKNTRAYEAFQKFYKCKRESGETFEEFIIRFERLYGDLERYDMKLPEGIRAFFVLNAANLTAEMEKLARATTLNITYKDMKEQIKKICGTVSSSSHDDDHEHAPPVKDEVLLGYAGGRSGRGGYKKGRGGRGRGRSNDQQRSSHDEWRSETSGSRDKKRTDEASNFVNQYGIQMRCFGCDSTQHLLNDCPKKTKKPQEINLILLNLKPDKKQKTLVMEALGKGVLDCGCTRTVAGEFWMKEFLSTLSADDAELVEEESSTAMFRFGDGGECKSLKRMVIPIKIGSANHLMRVEVVSNEIPLLISKAAMKSLGVSESNLDLKNDKWLIDGEEVRLHCTTSGHYCVPVNVFQVNAENITLKVVELENLGKKEKRAKAIKLHRQFGHASESKLLKLIKESHVEDKQFNACVKEVCESCDICRKFKAPPLKPTVSLPIATRFNQVVCLDLKEYVKNKVWIMHMIDAATRYTAARLITTKKKEVIATKLFEMWISYFGKPKTLMSDNGGEFANSLYTEVSQKLGINMVMPPAESPFSNGIVERHNKILFETMMKTKEDAACDADVALAWACSAKNALQNHGGYSPNQLVFGYNVNLPTVLTDRLPALETTTSSEIIRSNLEAIHSARKNYIEAENSDKIRRALKHKTRVYSEEDYQTGDRVYFKRRHHKGWMGPGSVMGFDGYTVLVKLGSSVFKCHRCHVMKSKSNLKDGITTVPAADTVSTADTVPAANEYSEARSRSRETRLTSFVVDDSSDSSDSTDNDATADRDYIPIVASGSSAAEASFICNEAGVEDNRTLVSDSNADEDATGGHLPNWRVQSISFADLENEDTDELVNDTIRTATEAVDDMEQAMINILGTDAAVQNLSTDEDVVENDEDVERAMINLLGEDAAALNLVERRTDDEVAIVDGNEDISTVETGQDQCESDDDHVPCERPKQKSYVSIKMDDQWFDALVMSYQPKKTGVNRDWMNVHAFGDAEPRSINWTHVQEWHHAISPEIPIFLTKHQESEQDVVDAKFKELENLRRNDVFDEVQFTGQPTISCRWVFTEKRREDGSKLVKARLVARGFEENSEELNIRTDSPTCSRHSLKIVMMTAAAKKWKVRSIDVASAFLQGNPIQRDIYIRPPGELCVNNMVWKLKRCLYGLNDAPREWYNKIYDEFVKSGAVRSTLDNAMFMWYDNDELIGHLVSHVDDFNYTGTDKWQRDVIDVIKGNFNISAEAESNFMYLGLNVNQGADEITIDQKHYIDKLQEIPLSADRKKLNDEPATKDERSKLRSLSGQMLWVTSQTRPDSAFGTCMMSNPGKSPTVKQLKEANKTVRKLKNSNNVMIKIPNVGHFDKMEIVVHGDASHARLADGSSQGAFIVFISGNGKLAPVLWRSKKLKRVTKSPLASEILAVGEASDAGILIANVLKEVYKLKEMPKVTCYTDSKSMKDNLNTTNTIDDMSVRVEVARLREMVNRTEISYVWVQSKDNLADVMTKRTASSDALLDVLAKGGRT